MVGAECTEITEGLSVRQYSSKGLEKIRLSNEARFLAAARAKFDGRFDYSEVVYRRQKLPITIRCPRHGDFSQTPDKHLQSLHGCPKCGVDRRASLKKDSGNRRFSSEFIKKFGDRLELLSAYISVKQPIRFRCKIHNLAFNTTPDRLNISKYGCPKCARVGAAENLTLTNEEFIKRAVAKFGDSLIFPRRPIREYLRK